VTDENVVVFVCPHGAGKSRLAAAWFNALDVPGWHATSAGLEPQPGVSVHAARLLAGTPVRDLLDEEPPRPLSAVPDPDLVVTIDCPGPVGGTSWRLAHVAFDDAMCAEIRDRVRALAETLT